MNGNGIEQLIISLKQAHEETLDLMKPLPEEGLTHGHMFLLFMVQRKGRIKTTEIAGHLELTAGAATAIADKLEKLGFIIRERDLKDRRVVFISLSAEGKQFIADKRNSHIALFSEVLKDLTDEETASLVRMLTKITEAVQAYKQRQQNQ